MSEKLTVDIGTSASISTWLDGEWTILLVKDGSGAQTTVSLSPLKALDLAALLKGSGITASGLKG